MQIFQNIMLIRAGNAVRKKAGHPVHHPAPLTLKYAGEVLKNLGFNTHIQDYWVDPLSLEDLLARIDSLNIDTVVVEIGSPAAEAGVRLCAQLKEHRHPFVIITGSDVSEKPQYYNSLKSIYDIILRGEYELELGKLIQTLRSSKVTDDVIQYYNTTKIKELSLVDDLNDLPIITWHRQELKQYPYIYPLKLTKRILSGYISTSRGCPHGCTFCSPTVRKSYGRQLRLRSPEKVVDEIQLLNEQGVNMISFEDDDFTLNKEHVRAICEEIIQRGLKVSWACHARVDEVSPDILAIMKKAGCALLLFGIESGSQRVVNILHKAAARQGWRQRAIEAFAQVRAAGIDSCAMFIVGSPTEGLEDVNQSIDLAAQMNPDLIKVHFFTLYPGSVDYKTYSKKQEVDSSLHHYQKPIVNLSNMDMSLLKHVQRRFYRKFFFRPSFLFSHLFGYLPFYLSNAPDSLKLIRDGLLFLFAPMKNQPRVASRKADGRQSSVH